MPLTIIIPNRRSFMRHFRLGRLAATVALLGSTLALAGGTVLATAGPASAAAGGQNVCSTFVGSADLSQGIPMLTGTFSNCHQQGSGTVGGVLDITGAPAPVTILWATGHATSVGSISAVIDFSGGPCPAGDVAADVTLLIGGGPYATPPALPGSGIICADISGFPVIALTNFGPVTI
jgi:hypothetical protein